jgi:outer membrane protein assembly factor BamB
MSWSPAPSRAGLNGCRTHEIATGQAGVAVSQRCAKGKERIQLINSRTGRLAWRTDISTPSLRLLAVGTNSVVVYQGGLVKQVIVLGPDGRYVNQFPCDCGDGETLTAGAVHGTAFSGGTMGVVGVGGVVLVGGPLGLAAIDGGTGQTLWQKAVDGGPVHRILSAGGDAHLVSGDGALIRVDPTTGALRTLIPGAPGELDPDAIVVPAGGYLAAGSARRGFAFTPLP